MPLRGSTPEGGRRLCATRSRPAEWKIVGVPHPQKRSGFGISEKQSCEPAKLTTQMLPQRLFHLAEPIGTLQNLAWLGTIGSAHNAVLLH